MLLADDDAVVLFDARYEALEARVMVAVEALDAGLSLLLDAPVNVTACELAQACDALARRGIDPDGPPVGGDFVAVHDLGSHLVYLHRMDNEQFEVLLKQLEDDLLVAGASFEGRVAALFRVLGEGVGYDARNRLVILSGLVQGLLRRPLNLTSWVSCRNMCVKCGVSETEARPLGYGHQYICRACGASWDSSPV